MYTCGGLCFCVRVAWATVDVFLYACGGLCVSVPVCTWRLINKYFIFFLERKWLVNKCVIFLERRLALKPTINVTCE